MLYNYYICNGKRARKCSRKRVSKEWIEDLVVSEMMKILSTDGFIDTVADKVMEYQSRLKDDSALRALEARQKEIERAISNLMTAIEQGIITPTTKSRLVELESERERINKGIAKEIIKEPELERDAIVWFLERFLGGNIRDEAFRAFLVDTFLNAVFLYDDKLVLVFNYSGENNSVTLKSVENSVIHADAPCSFLEPSAAPNVADLNIVLFFFEKVIATVVQLQKESSRS